MSLPTLPVSHTLLWAAAPDFAFETLHSRYQVGYILTSNKTAVQVFFLDLEPHASPAGNLKFLNDTVS